MPAARWDASGAMWGSYDGHCIELSSCDSDEIDELLLRIDLRVSGVLVGRLIAFAAGDELVLRTSDGATIEPDAKHVAAAARASDGARFVADPIAFLAALHSATRT
jgi:hypothetical protein